METEKIIWTGIFLVLALMVLGAILLSDNMPWISEYTRCIDTCKDANYYTKTLIAQCIESCNQFNCN